MFWHLLENRPSLIKLSHNNAELAIYYPACTCKFFFQKIKKVEMDTLEECSIGVFQKSDCHRTKYGHNKSLMN